MLSDVFCSPFRAAACRYIDYSSAVFTMITYKINKNNAHKMHNLKT